MLEAEPEIRRAIETGLVRQLLQEEKLTEAEAAELMRLIWE